MLSGSEQLNQANRLLQVHVQKLTWDNELTKRTVQDLLLE